MKYFSQISIVVAGVTFALATVGVHGLWAEPPREVLAGISIVENFEADNASEIFGDWKFSRTAGPASSESIGSGALEVKGSESEQPEATRRFDIPVKTRSSVLTISSLVKYSAIRSFREGEGNAFIGSRFLDGEGQEVQDLRRRIKWTGTSSWKPWAKTFEIPDGAAVFELVIGLEGALGKLIVDEIEILWGFPEDIDRENLIVDGGFERITKLSPWRLSGKSEIVFPAFRGRGALRVPGKKNDSSKAEQIWAFEENHRIERIRLHVQTKFVNVTRQKGSDGVSVKVELFDENGSKVRKKYIAKKKSGNLDWYKLTKSIQVPPKARYGKLTFEIKKSTGTAYFDKVKLEIEKTAGQIERVLEYKTDTSNWIPFIPSAELLSGPLDVSHLLDAPAGKHGYLEVGEKGFVFQDGTAARFLGINLQGEANFPTHEDAPIIAKRIAQHGFNLVRLHHMDAKWAEPNIFDPNRNDTRHLSAESLDQLDFFIAELKKNGIYIYVDLLVRRQFKKGDGVRDFQLLSGGAKVVSLFDEKMIELQKEYATQLLTHVNPYTKKKLVEDPAFTLIDLANENSFFMAGNRAKSIPPTYLHALNKKWLAYAERNDIENKTESGIFLDMDRKDVRAFYAELQRAYFKEMRDHLLSIGVQIPIAGSNLAIEGEDLQINAELDFVDRHAYWDHPKGGFGNLVTFKNESAIKVPQRHNPITKLARQRVKEMPFVVSEWNFPWPNEYRSIGPMLMTSYALFQNWDGLVLFNFQNNLNPHQIESNFDTSNKPDYLFQFPTMARMFHRKDIQPFKTELSFPVSSDTRVPPRPTFLHGISRTFGEPDASLLEIVKSYTGNSWQSDTGELRWEKEKGYVLIDSPRTQAVLGDLTAGHFRTESAVFEPWVSYGTLTIVSLDNQPLSKSKNLLLTALGRVENSATVYNDTRTLLRSSGTSPTLIEPVLGRLLLPINGRGFPEVHLLDSTGRHAGQVTAEEEQGQVIIPLGEAPMYEINFGSVNRG